jgi:NitT/TauT family transport system substrate-binding protein
MQYRAVLAGFMRFAAVIPVVVVMTATAQAADKVTLRTSWTWWPGNTPFFVAQEKGYYKDANIEVDIQQGQGSKTTSLTVGQGRDTFGENSTSTTATSISAGVPVKVVAGYWQRGPIGLVCGASAGVKTPADLKGKSIASTPTGSDYQLMVPFLTASGLSVQDVKTVALGDTKLPALLSGQVDCLSGDVLYWQQQAEDRGAKTVTLLFADYGITNLSYGLIASDDIIQKNPDLVRRFVQATIKGVEYAFGHTGESADIYLKRTNNLDSKKQVVAILEYWKAQTHTKNTEGKPLGWMAAADWDAMNDILEKYGEMKGRKPANAYFTNDFVAK